jgi:hypothetical protein
MPPYRRPAQLPPRLRSLNDALHDLHDHAGMPSTRQVSKAVSENDLLPTTASHERVRSAFSSETLPQWALVHALVTVLCPLADRKPGAETGRFKSLWLSAVREARGEPEPAPKGQPVVARSLVEDGLWPAPAERGNFALSMTKALSAQLVEAFSTMPRHALSESGLGSVEQGPGVYQLFHRDDLVYVGKGSSLRSRLAQAERKISGRRNISLDDMSFSWLRLDEDFAGIAPEALLIKQYRQQGSVPWNRNGFGNKEPGRARDGQLLDANHFDVRYPINLDLRVADLEGQVALADAVSKLKSTLPYMFRCERELSKSQLVLDFKSGPRTVSDVIATLVRGLGRGWQGTALPGYVILYRDHGQPYPSALRVYLSDGSS